MFCHNKTGIYSLWKAVVHYIGVTSASKVPRAHLTATLIFHLIVNMYIFSSQNKWGVLFHPAKCDCSPCKTGIQPITFVLLERPISPLNCSWSSNSRAELCFNISASKTTNIEPILKNLWPLDHRDLRDVCRNVRRLLCFKFSLSCIWSQSML